MGWLTPKYPEGAEPAKAPSRRQEKAAKAAADREKARSEGWIVPDDKKPSVGTVLKKFWNETADY